MGYGMLRNTQWLTRRLDSSSATSQTFFSCLKSRLQTLSDPQKLHRKECTNCLCTKHRCEQGNCPPPVCQPTSSLRSKFHPIEVMSSGSYVGLRVYLSSTTNIMMDQVSQSATLWLVCT